MCSRVLFSLHRRMVKGTIMYKDAPISIHCKLVEEYVMRVNNILLSMIILDDALAKHSL